MIGPVGVSRVILQPIAYDFLANLSGAVLEEGVTEDQVRQDAFSIDNEPRQVLFVHPTNRVSYSLEFAGSIGAGLWDRHGP
jgi:hypothetical protein